MWRLLQKWRTDGGQRPRRAGSCACRRSLRMEALEQRLTLSTTAAFETAPTLPSLDGGLITLDFTASAEIDFVGKGSPRLRDIDADRFLTTGDFVLPGTYLLGVNASPTLGYTVDFAGLDPWARLNLGADGSGDAIRIIPPPAPAELPTSAELIDVAMIMRGPQILAQRPSTTQPNELVEGGNSGDQAPQSAAPAQEITARHGRDMALEVAATAVRRSRPKVGMAPESYAEVDEQPSEPVVVTDGARLPSGATSHEGSTASLNRAIDLLPDTDRDDVTAEAAATTTREDPLASSPDEIRAEAFARWDGDAAAVDQSRPVLPREEEAESAGWRVWLAISAAPVVVYALRSGGASATEQVQPPPRRKNLHSR